MKVLVTGDYCLNGRSLSSDKNELSSALVAISNFVKNNDYSIVNLECSVHDGQYKPIKKVGPNLSCGIKALENLRDTGFKCLALANNHFADYGGLAVDESLKQIDDFGFDRVGAGRNFEEASKTLIVEIKEKKLAIINCCEHEFTIAGENEAGCNPLDIVEQYKAILKARKEADYVLIIVHGGSEHYQLPTPRMQKTYRFFLDVGADVVVNCHQHCFSGYEIYNGKHIFYGLGNFFFDWPERRNGKWNKGYMLQLDFSDEISFELIPYSQCDDTLEIRLLSAEEKAVFENDIDRLNSVIKNEKALQDEFSIWIKNNIDDYLWAFHRNPSRWERYKHKIYKLLDKNSQINKSVLSHDMMMSLLSYTRCESHRDILIDLLERKTSVHQG